ncbi:MAG: hypothetical protein ACO1QB_02860 [Verrucomicrobiales bacterium]
MPSLKQIFGALLLCAASFTLLAQEQPLKTKHVILITADGLRWEEVFRGAEKQLMTRDAGRVGDTNRLLKEFWREDLKERRKALMPFFWNTIAEQGEIWGNVDRGSLVKVKNGLNFSYPGYNELLSGIPDPRIDSNDKKPNPNMTVLEFMHGQPGFKGKIGVFSAWDVHPFIVNRDRVGLQGRSAFEMIKGDKLSPKEQMLNALIAETTPEWGSVSFDSFVHHSAMEFFHKAKPRLLYVAYGETDDWAHSGHYEKTLLTARLFDKYVGEWWKLVQSLPDYKDQTTLLVTTDHGRGSGLTEWKHHGSKVVGAENIWVAVIGPDTQKRGELGNSPAAFQSQVANTVAKLLGKDLKSGSPQADGPLPLWEKK